MKYRKFDLVAKHPASLYRKIHDICEDEMPRKNYFINYKKTFWPKLNENEIYGGVSRFSSKIQLNKNIWNVNMLFAVIGIVVIGIGVVACLMAGMNSMMHPFGFYAIGVILIVVGLVIIFIKSKTHLVIKINMYGETYALWQTDENIEEFIVKSDVRMRVTYGHPEDANLSYEQENILQHDTNFLFEKLDEMFRSEEIEISEI